MRLSLHDHCRLHEQSGHADDIGLVLDRSIENGRDGLLDAEVHDVVTVVTQDDVDKVLADIVDVALDRRNDEATLAVVVRRFHVRLEERNCCLHDLGGLQNERQLHLSGTEQFTDGLHARKQCLVDDFDRGLDRHRFGEIVVEAVALAVDDATLEPVEQRKSGEFLRTRLTRRRCRNALEQSHQLLQRVVPLATTVVDEVECSFTLLVRNSGHRQNLGRV